MFSIAAGLLSALVFASTNCELTENEKSAYLQMDFHTFDQTQEGWRGVEDRGCRQSARDLIEAYIRAHHAELKARDVALLHWHSGQLSAFLEETGRAVESMKAAIDEEEPADDPFQWNAYANGSIAFLLKDRQVLEANRAKAESATSPWARRNIRILDAMLRCFGQTYFRVYNFDCEPKETNLERIRTMRIPLSSELAPPHGVRQALANMKVVMVGEVHGTNEIPSAFGELVASLALPGKKTLVGLEIWQSSQAAIDEFLRTGDESVLARDPFFLNAKDGRTSKAMVRLLRQLATLPGVEVLCFDPMGGSEQERDTGMAEAIAKKMPRFDRTFLLAGNLHTSIEIGTPWTPDRRNMGHELVRMAGLKQGEFVNFYNRHAQSSYWGCDLKDCGLVKRPEIPTDYSEATPENAYVMLEDSLQNGHSATLFIRRTTPSEPMFTEGR